MNRAVIIVLAGVLMLAGCARKGGTVVVKDPGPAQRAEALRLADLAEKADKAGDMPKAIQLYEQSLEVSSEFAGVWHNLGMLYLKRGDRGDRMKAVEMLKGAVSLDPERPTAYYNIGLIYEQSGQPDKAMEYFKQALDRDKLYLPALRGAAKVGRMLIISDEESLERMKMALLLEKDPAWRKVFEEEKLRIDGALQAAGKTGKF